MRKNDPESRIQLQWDKLFINNEVYVYCEETGCVEHEVADSIINNVGLTSDTNHMRWFAGFSISITSVKTFSF